MKEYSIRERLEIAKKLRKEYSKGDRVKLIHMDDKYTKIPTGTVGTVNHIDDMATIHVHWDNGSSLGVIYGEDEIEKINTQFVKCDNCKSKIELGEVIWCKPNENFCSPWCALEYYDIVESVVEEEFFG